MKEEYAMLILIAVIMGIVEGITEFLPVSSTGHLIITGAFLNFNSDFAKMFTVVIQLGAIFAVMYNYKNKITQSLKTITNRGYGFKLWINVLVAFIPSAVLGLLYDDIIEEYLFSPLNVAYALIFGAILMILVQRICKNYKYDNMDKFSYKNSFIIGIGQCFSLIPGMSRSASTIMGGMIAGYSVKASAEFSFFLAMPTMIAATGYKLVKESSMVMPLEWVALVVGFLVSFIVALFVVKKFLEFLSKNSLDVFAYYRIAIGIIMILLIRFNVLNNS